MNTKHHFLLFPITLALILALPASAADEKKVTLTPTDERFIKEASASCLSIQKYAELGVKSAERPDVKDYAELLVRDFTRINLAFKLLANTKGIQLIEIPQDLKQIATFQKLEKIDRKAFDKSFLDELENSYKKLLNDFEEELKTARDEDLKNFVDTSLPSFRNHMDKLIILKNQLTFHTIPIWQRSEYSTDAGFN